MKNKEKAKIKPPKCLFWDKSTLLNTAKTCVQKPQARVLSNAPGCSAVRRGWAGGAGLGLGGRTRRFPQQPSRAPWHLGVWELGISHTPDHTAWQPAWTLVVPPSPLFLLRPLSSTGPPLPTPPTSVPLTPAHPLCLDTISAGKP